MSVATDIYHACVFFVWRWVCLKQHFRGPEEPVCLPGYSDVTSVMWFFGEQLDMQECVYSCFCCCHFDSFQQFEIDTFNWLNVFSYHHWVVSSMKVCILQLWWVCKNTKKQHPFFEGPQEFFKLIIWASRIQSKEIYDQFVINPLDIALKRIN